jgi:malonate transporter and related proteins
MQALRQSEFVSGRADNRLTSRSAGFRLEESGNTSHPPNVPYMFGQILNIMGPIFFVLLLGYGAGRANRFDSHQVAGINELVLDFALPASLFVGTVSASRTQLLQETPLLVAMLVSLVVLYVGVFLLGKLLFRHTVAGAALQAITVSFTAGPFFGPAVLGPIYGASSAVAISMIALILNIIIVPMTLIILGMSIQPAESGTKPSTGVLLGSALVRAIKAPFVWAPLVGFVLVMVGLRVPSVVDSALSLIGHATGGIALFVAGVSIAAHKIIFNLEVGVNAVLKMIVLPAFCFVLALALRVKSPFIYEGLLVTALPSGPIGILLATRYKIYESEASSTVAVTTILMVLTIPIALYLMGGA